MSTGVNLDIRNSSRFNPDIRNSTRVNPDISSHTKMAIIKASSLPISIIIIGVGDADFTEMEALDSDDRLLRHNNMVARRDIVQFVELRQFVSGTYWNKEMLAKTVLAEIPGQLSSWMKMKGFKPLHTNIIAGNIR